MCPSHIRSLCAITARRMSPPAHLSYHWQRPAHDRKRLLGAGIIDPDAFQRAMDAAMPADSFDATHFAKE